MKSRVTLRDIAAEAGVHFSTVSLALRGSPRLPAAQIARIRAVAERLGYAPDPALAALNAYRKSVLPVGYQSTLVWLNNWPDPAECRRVPAFGRYFEGALAQAARLGYRLEEFALHAPGMTLASASSILRARGVTGLLLAPQPHANTRLDDDFPGFSAVSIGFSLRPARFHVVTNHQAQSMQLLMAELRALGHRRVGLYLKKDYDEKVNHHFLGGLLLAQHDLPARDRVPHFMPPATEREGFVDWFTRHRPDVVICVDPRVRAWLKELGLAIPRDVGLVDLNVDPDDPATAGVHQNDRLIGATAVDFLAGMIQRNERGVPAVPIRTLVESTWHTGASVRPQDTKKPRAAKTTRG